MIDRTRHCARAFTLLEMLVATTVLLLMLVLLLGIVSHVSQYWQRAEGAKIHQQAARQVLETISRDLEAALFPLDIANQQSFQFCVNDPRGLEAYQNPDAVFWQTTSTGDSGSGDIVEVGYFVCWSGTGVHSEIRRLRVPSPEADIFDHPNDWISAAKLTQLAPGSDEPATQKGLLAENVIGLWISLFNRQGMAISLPYNSRVDLDDPARRIGSVEIALALIDSRTLKRLADKNEITAHYEAANADAFLELLPPAIRQGVRVFKTRVNLEASPR